MNDTFRQAIETAIRSGLSVSQIERQFGMSNRNVRRLKAAMYDNGTLPRPTGWKPKVNYANDNR